MQDPALAAFRDAIEVFREFHKPSREDTDSVNADADSEPSSWNERNAERIKQQENQTAQSSFPNDIYDALAGISQSLANGYAQVKLDLVSSSRLSWAGDAREIREVLSTLLRTLAPDGEVIQQSWFKPETKDGKPSQKQRAKYILQLHGAGSSEREVAEQVDLMEDAISSLVRSTYMRASDAAHRAKGKSEVERIVRYFDAFAYDLLNLKTDR